MLKMDKMGLTLYDRVVIPILIEKITKKAWQSLFLWYNIDTLFKRVVVHLDLTPKGLFFCAIKTEQLFDQVVGGDPVGYVIGPPPINWRQRS